MAWRRLQATSFSPQLTRYGCPRGLYLGEAGAAQTIYAKGKPPCSLVGVLSDGRSISKPGTVSDVEARGGDPEDAPKSAEGTADRLLCQASSL